MFQIFEQERKSDLNMINHSSSMHERTCSTTCQITLFIFKMFQIFEQEPQASSLKFSYYVTKKKGNREEIGRAPKKKNFDLVLDFQPTFAVIGYLVSYVRDRSGHVHFINEQ